MPVVRQPLPQKKYKTFHPYRVFEHSHGVLDLGDVERQHDMRIAAKRLRYVLEIAGPCFGVEAAAARGRPASCRACSAIST